MRSVGIEVSCCVVGKILPTYEQRYIANDGLITGRERTFDNFMRALNTDIRRHLQMEITNIL